MIHFHKKNHRIGLDIDEVLANFLSSYSEYMNIDYTTAKHFYFSYQTNDNLNILQDDFWLNMKPKVNGHDLNFLPSCYISSRNFDTKITEQWLENNGFPCMPVIHTSNGGKMEACKQMNVGIFVDDFLLNFQELSAVGIHTMLMDCTHNKQYDVDPYRLMDLNDLPSKIIELGF